MQTVDFSRYKYVPAILSDPVGEVAYTRLSAETRAGVLALFELCWRPRARDFEDCIGFISRVEGSHPYLLDIDKRRAPAPYEPRDPSDPVAAQQRYCQEKAAQVSFNSELDRLLRPNDGFYNWREFLSRFPSSIPVLQMTNPAAQWDDILRQAELLCVGGASAAFRIRETRVEDLCSLACEILQRLPNPRQLLIILDCGQGRVRLPQRAAFASNALEMIQSQIGAHRMKAFRAVCMSNSFTLPAHKGMRFKENHDWEVWQRVSATIPLAFGDYAASEREEAHSSYRPWDYRATVTHALPGGWLISRHANKNDPKGWTDGCQKIEKDFRFAPLSSWCDRLISETAKAAETASEEPRFWHASRINGHIERQYSQATRRVR
ncbi:MAG TPA: hypothetical protein VFZ91_01915 [Allosphingosinicella sp.]